MSTGHPTGAGLFSHGCSRSRLIIESTNSVMQAAAAAHDKNISNSLSCQNRYTTKSLRGHHFRRSLAGHFLGLESVSWFLEKFWPPCPQQNPPLVSGNKFLGSISFHCFNAGNFEISCCAKACFVLSAGARKSKYSLDDTSHSIVSIALLSRSQSFGTSSMKNVSPLGLAPFCGPSDSDEILCHLCSPRESFRNNSRLFIHPKCESLFAQISLSFSTCNSRGYQFK